METPPEDIGTVTTIAEQLPESATPPIEPSAEQTPEPAASDPLAPYQSRG